VRDDLTGAYNYVWASIANHGSLSTWVLVSDGTKSEAKIEKKKPNLTLH